MKTGKTQKRHGGSERTGVAAMEPGHEDREDDAIRGFTADITKAAAMEPGHEDREDRRAYGADTRRRNGRNGWSAR